MWHLRHLYPCQISASSRIREMPSPRSSCWATLHSYTLAAWQMLTTPNRALKGCSTSHSSKVVICCRGEGLLQLVIVHLTCIAAATSEQELEMVQGSQDTQTWPEPVQISGNSRHKLLHSSKLAITLQKAIPHTCSSHQHLSQQTSMDGLAAHLMTMFNVALMSNWSPSFSHTNAAQSSRDKDCFSLCKLSYGVCTCHASAMSIFKSI